MLVSTKGTKKRKPICPPHTGNEAQASARTWSEQLNAENILKVADAIEMHSIPGLVFHMNYEFTEEPHTQSADMIERNIGTTECGAAACIVGWTNKLIPTGEDLGDWREAAGKLGLSDNDALQLFYPDEIRSYDLIAPADAARTLRHLAVSGEVDWLVE